MKGIVLFAHGARDPEWARPVEAIRDAIRRQRPEYPIEIAYLEYMSPTLEDGIASVLSQGASCVTVFPLFLAQGGHLKHDIPRILGEIRAANPRIPIALEAALGDAPEIREAIARWILSK